jgi:hypothetical protein
MTNYLIFHGHFYQPPRENPWTGLVDTQESAAPYHDWNARITKECYAANAASRFLHFDGRIEDIINNYRALSFNFGPTLMWWLKKEAPRVYDAILEADRLSIGEHNGHGNALAQAYNHTILPLDSPEDARIQIRWGLADFEHHFGRSSEGIWLPETAINERIIDILIEEGVKFVILSPWQAEAVLAEGSKDWEELGNKPAPSHHAYRIDRPAGSLAVFLYNQDLAQGLSFEHYLKSADALYTRLLSLHNAGNPGHLIHAATDGEVYGHHEAFGDMCLAALQKHVHRDKKFRFSNYGEYLEHFPPRHQVRLRPGEGGLGSSWSCHHGVSRWFRDCGCTTGGEKGWNQRWRSPLREGLRKLSGQLLEVYGEKCSLLTNTPPEALLKDYIRVLTGSTSPEEFAREHLREELWQPENVSTLLTLLEGQKYRLYSFTSCGWFFSELSGIETIQNLRYALKAVELYRPLSDLPLLEDLSSDLEEARSNIKEKGSGRDILLREKDLLLPEGLEAAAYYFLLLLIYSQEASDSAYGYFVLHRIQEKKRSDSGLEAKFLEAEIEVIDTTRLKHFAFLIIAENDDKGRFALRVKNLASSDTAAAADGKREGESVWDLRRFPTEFRQKLNSFLLKSTEESIAEHAAKTFKSIRFAVRQAEYLEISPPSLIVKTAEISVTTLLYRRLDGNPARLDEKKTTELENLLSFAAHCSISIDQSRISHRLTSFMWTLFDRLEKEICSKECVYVGRLIIALRKAGIEPELTIPQKVIFAHLLEWRTKLSPGFLETGTLHRIKPELIASLAPDQREELSNLVALCDVIGIYADDIKYSLAEAGNSQFRSL